MTLRVIADRVQETTATTGTGPISLGGASTQCQTFISGVGDGNECTYILLSGNGTDWESGITLVHAGSPPTLTRDKILYSSNSNAAISLSGTSTVALVPTGASLYDRQGRRPTRISASSMTWFNQAMSIAVDHPGGPLSLITPNLSLNSENVRGLLAAPPSAPWTLTAEIEFFHWMRAYMYQGIAVMDTTGKLVTLCFYTNTPNNSDSTNIRIDWWNSPSSYASGHLNAGILPMQRTWFRIYNDGTNLKYYISPDGANWSLLLSHTIASASLGTIAGVGLFTNIDYVQNPLTPYVMNVWSLEIVSGTGSNVQWT